MEAYKCDRCGSFYEEASLSKSKKSKEYFDIKVLTYEGYIGSHGSPTGSMDLCPKCKEELVKFLNLEKKS